MSDLIERDKAIDAIRKLPNAGPRWIVSAESVFKVLMQLPSARPKEGKWIEVERYPIAVPSKWCKNDEKPIYASKLQCSKCGFTRNFLDGHTAQYNFCPQCGADMTEREGE